MRIEPPERDRLVSLAIPPAWDDVWLCPQPKGHLQAVGRDAADRKQYRYHDAYRALRDQQKFDRLAYFPKALRRLRPVVSDWLDEQIGSERYALGAVIRLLDVGLLRLGNDVSAAGGAHGATTLHADHVTADPDEGYVVLQYRGKGGKARTVVVEDDEMMDVLRELANADAERLFWFIDAMSGERRRVRGSDVNRAIAEIAGPAFSAKDFRTWGGSRRALEARAEGADEVAAVDEAAETLGNTRAVARSAYVHPRVLAATDTDIARAWQRSRASQWFTRADSALAKLLASD